MKEIVQVVHIERLYRMSDVDRQCPGCGYPFMAMYDAVSDTSVPFQQFRTWDCPRCGRPTSDEHNISRDDAKKLRSKLGLLK